MSRRLRDPESAAAVFLLTALAFIALALIGGVFLGRATKSSSTVTVSVSTTPGSTQTVDPKVAAGAHDFVNFACAQCHGLDGRGGVSPYVPALKGASTLTAAAAQPDHQPRRRGVGRPEASVHARLGAGDLDPAGRRPGRVHPRRAAEGADGDAGHGSDGTGRGREGPGAVHALRLCQLPRPERARRRAESRSRPTRRSRRSRGPTSSSEFNTDAKIRDFIVSGSVLGKAPIVSMPHWGGIIPPARLDALVAYIKTLKTS